MTPLSSDRLKTIKDFDSLIDFLKTELDWPLDSDSIDDLTFEYEPEELGLSSDVAVNINFIKQLRPLAQNQPWGIFYIDFEPKQLPVVVLRRVLQKLVIKQRVKAKDPKSQIWHLHDLLFINSFGEQQERAITFAHFSQEEKEALPTLRVVGWNGQHTPLHLDRCLNELGYLHYDSELNADQWRSEWSKAFKTKLYESIKTSKMLAQTLAKLAQTIRINATHILKYESQDGQFHKTLKKFKQSLIHDLTEDDFSDMYAQTLAYGLLYTAIRSHIKGEPSQISVERAQQLVLPTNPFLKEVMEDFFNIGSRRWDSEKELMTGIDFDELGINDIVSALKDEKTDFDAILRDFGNKNPNEDPVIHFYESFLKEYDALKRKNRGVYYTPQPVVSFIVRSVHEVLKRDFGLEYGLADTTTWGEMIKKNPDITLPGGVSERDFFVQILDPAVGTGTFLVETIDIIYKTMVSEWRNHHLNDDQIEKAWNRYVPEKLLPRLYGFELMMAPYAIAHMKIGIKLYETGYKNFEKDKKRVQVYLTNTLEEPLPMATEIKGVLAEEGSAATKIKMNNVITIIIGNPPYSGHSFNNGLWISNLLRIKLVDGADSYFKVDGQDLGERNPKWLNDDYVKFIRYSQYRIANTGIGVHGFITNHAYIDNPTFRGMRQSLLKSFREMDIIDMHGGANKKEKCLDGGKDENVFDIMQGVCIGLFIKKAKSQGGSTVYSVDLWGKRIKKIDWLNSRIAEKKNCELLIPDKPFYLFCPQDKSLLEEYNRYCKITNIMTINSVGIVTSRDDFVVSFDRPPLVQIVKELICKEITDGEILKRYNLIENNTWSLSKARRKLHNEKDVLRNITTCLYRPFDKRYLFYNENFIERVRSEIMQHMLRGENIALLVSRQITKEFKHVFVTKYIANFNALDTAGKFGSGPFFPLYIYPTDDEFDFSMAYWPKGKNGRTPNVNPKYVTSFSDVIKLNFVNDSRGDLKKDFGPEDLLTYIYAVFNSPNYRSRYSVFMKSDFPRVPIPSDTKMFCDLVKLGSELISLHLMESAVLNMPITVFPALGDNIVTKVGETGKKLANVKDGKGKLYINSQQYFDKLPEEVWNFHIGGYQVCHKWLADRKGRTLSAEDIEHYQKVVVALNETIKIMVEIDKTIDAHGGWPGAFVTKE
jgi:predicted helicase